MKKNLALFVALLQLWEISSFHLTSQVCRAQPSRISKFQQEGWVQDANSEWEWEEDDPTYLPPAEKQASTFTTEVKAVATPTLPKGSFRPKQSLGQNFLRDGNTVAKIIKTFVSDATKTIIENDSSDQMRAVELGPGATMSDLNASFQCIEIDPRSIELLGEKHPMLRVHHMDVMQVDYPSMAEKEGGPLSIIGNLPYYITSQILFALADASHSNAVRSATVTMQYEVGERIVAKTSTNFISKYHRLYFIQHQR